MEQLIDEVCAYICNYFPEKPYGIHYERFNISDGSIDADFLQNGQYFRIKGSVFNDGVYKYPTNELQDEEFIGEVWAMRIPQGFQAVCLEIQEWQAKYENVNSPNYSPFVSESFNNYSYSKGSRSNGASSSSGSPMTWQDVFAKKLNRWRRLSDAL